MTIRTATTAQTPEDLLNDLRNLVSDADMMLGEATGPDHAIRTHPYQSLAIALGTGLLLGWLVGRRHAR